MILLFPSRVSSIHIGGEIGYGQNIGGGMQVALRMTADRRTFLGKGNIALDYARTQNQWASEERTVEIMKLLEGYGVHAKESIPELKKFADWCRTEEDFPDWARDKKREAVEAAIKRIEASTEKPKLISMSDLRVKSEK